MRQQGDKMKPAQEGNNSVSDVNGAGTQDATIFNLKFGV